MDLKDALEELIGGSLRKTPPVSEQPVIFLVRWRVIEVMNRKHQSERHFIGYNNHNREGRASTAILQFDAATRQGVTESGRIYRLIGPPGDDPDAQWVWQNWSRMQNYTEQKDVSAELWSAVSLQRKEGVSFPVK